ncbi:succinate dehydrogenase cytochrome b subunit [Propionicicella superfundia]|uniref:succinate dehydrogenase cytochrome b subunit n=1 Tax=Propionicicella superfundia TaxID=348582 RepID=UPI0003FAD52A|nr:succinate dehydrogenase cytochrome b subunit [Propionicicella superfundia]
MTVSLEKAAPTTPKRRFPLSTFAAKVVMAVTGIVFAAFVFVHMVGNLKVFFGADHFNEYAAWLRDAFTPLLPHEGLLWILRAVLLAALVAHVGCAILVAIRGRRARGPHRRRALPLRTFGTRTMLVTGIVLFLFLVFHLLDLTIGAPPAATDVFEHGDAYANLVASFRRPWAAAVYIAAMLALVLHLVHGLWLSAHDLGVTGKRVRAVWKVLGFAVALVVAVGNTSIPLFILLGVVR